MGGDDIRPETIDYVLWAVDQGLNYSILLRNTAVAKANEAMPLFTRHGRDGRTSSRFPRSIFLAHAPGRLGKFSAAFPNPSLSQILQPGCRGNRASRARGARLFGQLLHRPGRRVAIRDDHQSFSREVCRKFDQKIDFKKVIMDSVEGSLKSLNTTTWIVF